MRTPNDSKLDEGLLVGFCYKLAVELKRFAGQEPPQEHNLPSIQQRIRARLSSVTGTSYSPSAIRHARPSGERKVVELISKPTHLSETGHLDPTTLGKSRSLSREETDGGEDEPDGGAPGEGVDVRLEDLPLPLEVFSNSPLHLCRSLI